MFASSNGHIAAMASRDSARAREMLAPYPGARVADSYESVLSDPQVDAVYIPLPNGLHKDWTLRALEAGKHVLCEKPLAVDAREAAEMAAAAERAGLHLMEAFMYRFHPAMREFVEAIREPLHVEAAFGFRLQDRDDIRMHAALGGGARLDVGSYTVSVSRWILGEPVDVSARARFDNDVDVTTTAMLRFADGATASLWASFESPEAQDLKVVTRRGVLRRAHPFTSYRDPHDPYQLMVESFADCVLHDRPVEIPPSESIANMRVLDQIREAAKDAGR